MDGPEWRSYYMLEQLPHPVSKTVIKESKKKINITKKSRIGFRSLGFFG